MCSECTSKGKTGKPAAGAPHAVRGWRGAREGGERGLVFRVRAAGSVRDPPPPPPPRSLPLSAPLPPRHCCSSAPVASRNCGAAPRGARCAQLEPPVADPTGPGRRSVRGLPAHPASPPPRRWVRLCGHRRERRLARLPGARGAAWRVDDAHRGGGGGGGGLVLGVWGLVPCPAGQWQAGPAAERCDRSELGAPKFVSEWLHGTLDALHGTARVWTAECQSCEQAASVTYRHRDRCQYFHRCIRFTGRVWQLDGMSDSESRRACGHGAARVSLTAYLRTPVSLALSRRVLGFGIPNRGVQL